MTRPRRYRLRLYVAAARALLRVLTRMLPARLLIPAIPARNAFIMRACNLYGFHGSAYP
jgi:hypothetical protein